MPACPECGTQNPDGFRFCGACGASLDSAGCATCGEPHEPEQRFCGRCGAALLESDLRTAPRARPAASGLGGVVAERRLATVLFADVVGFTSLAERTDPEMVARMVDAAFRELAAVVVEHGGTIDKYMGDSLMAVFGVPVAHDDDAERAVAAALAMRKLGGDLVFSIGINSGELMATPIGQDGGVTVIGDTVNVAARLEKAAGPGEVLCGPLTVELVGRRGVFRPRQSVILKGKREPVAVAEAVAVRPVGAEAAGDTIALIGRDDEMAYLQALWQRVSRDRQFHMVLLCGDAGSGKTRVAGELAALAAIDGKVVRASYPAYGAMGGVAVVEEVLRQVGPADDEEVTARVRSLAGHTDAALRAMDPEALHQEQLWGLLRLLEEKGEDRPLLVAIDDVHRSTESMLQLIGEVTARISDVPILMVLSGRSEPSSWLAHFPSATTVRLAPLPRSDALALAGALACDRPLSEEAATFIIERSAGNPLYMRELIRMARESGSLVDDGERYRLNRSAALPASLHAVLSARLDMLGAAQKPVFQLVAVLGAGATEQTIGRLGPAGSISAVHQLVDAGLLRLNQLGAHEAADPLLTEVAYEMLPRHVRGDMHRRAAKEVVAPEERARHLERAAEYLADDDALTEEAAEALARLGEEYAEAARYPEASRLLARAVALGCGRPSVLFRLADLQAMAGDDAGTAQTLALIQDDPDDPTVAIERDHASARARMFSDPVAVLPRLEEVAARWLEAGRPAPQAWALANAGVACFNLNRMEDAAHYLETSMNIFEEQGERAGVVASSSFLCLVKPADHRVAGWLGDALAFADETGDRSKQMTALSPMVWTHFLRTIWGDPGQTAEAEAFGMRLAELAEYMGAHEMAIQARSLLTFITRGSGRLEEAMSHGEALAALLDAPGHRDSWLGWSAQFVLAVAGGATAAAPPFPPAAASDPISAVAALAIRAELAGSGRIDEAVARLSAPHGATGDALAAVDALVLVLAGRPAEARPFAARAVTAAQVLAAEPGETLARALLAEIDRSGEELDPYPESAASVADLVLLRAHASLGSTEAWERLREGARRMRMPGLLLGVSVPTT